jgi:hypothetical protein
VPALTQLNGTASEHTTALTHALYGLIGAAEQRVLGMTSDAWLRRYENCTSAGVQQWAHDTQNSQAPAAWLARVEAQASSLTLQLSGASLFDGCCDQSLTLLAAALGSDPTFVERAELSGCSLESGAFNRAAWPRAQRPHEHVFGLLAARIVDVVQLCRPEPWLRSGCLRLGPAEAIAYTELARGLLVHWVKLALPELRAGRAVVEDYRIITPTDFALHPQGALAKRLRTPDLTPSDVQLLVGAFDPCLELEFASAATLGASDA